MENATLPSPSRRTAAPPAHTLRRRHTTHAPLTGGVWTKSGPKQTAGIILFQRKPAPRLILLMNINPPVIQIALDYPTIDEAIAMAKIGIQAGVDWLEVGTPLIVAQGAATIGQLKRAYPDYPVLADYKTMDSGGKNNLLTQKQGGQIMNICANAPDETVQAGIVAAKG